MCRLTPASTSAAHAVQRTSLRAIFTAGSSVIERIGNGIEVTQVTFEDSGYVTLVGEPKRLEISFAEALQVARECELDTKGINPESTSKIYFRREDDEVELTDADLVDVA
jgi:hypothetical protein